MRTTLAEHYGDKIVGMGGTFLIKKGKARQHVMPDFSKTPIHTDEEVDKWLKFYEMTAPLIAVGTFVSGDFVSYYILRCLLSNVDFKEINISSSLQF